MSPFHKELMEELSRIDKVFKTYADTYGGKKVKAVYMNYRNYPDIPDTSHLSVEETKGYCIYLNEHADMLADMQDIQEFEILTLVIGETKMSLWATSPEGIASIENRRMNA